MLHIINSFPVPNSFLDSTQSGDIVILTDNAVLAAKKENISKESFPQKALSHINIYVRKADLLIRDISNSDLFRGVVIIDHMQFETITSQDYMVRSYN